MFKSSIRRGPARPVAKTKTPRREERMEVQKAVSLVVTETGETLSGTIRDIHSRGARVSIISPERVPEKVLLKSRAADLETLAQVVWRRGNELGMRFVPR